MFIGFQGLGQKVAVVMSGGGAKGMAHIGMLKALEEYEIPIDYVVGTSMGGIIAGCYAAGMSPAHIQEVMLSDNLRRWINGQLEDGYNYYYYKKNDIRASSPSPARSNTRACSTPCIAPRPRSTIRSSIWCRPKASS